MAEIKVRKANRLLVAMVASLAGPVLFVSGPGVARAGTSSISGQRSVTAKVRQGHSAQAPSNQPAWANRGPAVAGDAQGFVHAAWENTNGQLVVALRDTSGNWTIHNLGFGPLGSQPTETATLQVTNSQNWHYVFWSGRGDSALNMAYWGSNGTWTGPVTIPNTADMVPGQPAATFINGTGTDSLIYVFWAGADKDIDYMYSSKPWDTSSWNGPNEAVYGPSNTAIGPVVGAPAAAGNCGSTTSCQFHAPVYWTADQNTVTRSVYDPSPSLSTWQAPVTDNNTKFLGSEPSAVSDKFAEDSSVAWRGSGGSADLFIMTDTYGNNAFTTPFDTGVGPLDSAPAVGEIGTDLKSAQFFYLWRGTNADLWTAHTMFGGGFSTPFDVGGQICAGPQC